MVRELRLQQLGKFTLNIFFSYFFCGKKYLRGEEVSELAGLVPAHVLVVHVHLPGTEGAEINSESGMMVTEKVQHPPESAHHGQLEILVIHRLVRPAGGRIGEDRWQENMVNLLLIFRSF